jgi:ribosomal protein S13
MIIGEHSRDNDLEVNPLKGKKLTNIRASGKDEAVRLTPPRKMSLEQAIAYIDDDELVEVTPKIIRLRKRGRCGSGCRSQSSSRSRGGRARCPARRQAGPDRGRTEGRPRRPLCRPQGPQGQALGL